MLSYHKIEYSELARTNKQLESMSATTATISSATAIELSAAATVQEQGLEFQVRECYEDDGVESVVPAPAAADTDDNQDDSEG